MPPSSEYHIPVMCMFVVIRAKHLSAFLLVLAIMAMVIPTFLAVSAPTGEESFKSVLPEGQTEPSESAPPQEETPPAKRLIGTIILDPGHGGMDGGAVSANGILEKDLNLQLSLTLRELLEAEGFNVVMTRETDISIHDPDKTTVKSQKQSDLKNRVALANSQPEAVLVSIHMNKFTQKKYWGSQVFYSKNHESGSVLAGLIQSQIRETMQPENSRETKMAGKEIYLLTNVTIPAVLVECGFLSNEQDTANLSSPDYQLQFAGCIRDALLKYFNVERM